MHFHEDVPKMPDLDCRNAFEKRSLIGCKKENRYVDWSNPLFISNDKPAFIKAYVASCLGQGQGTCTLLENRQVLLVADIRLK